ncbi:MAG: asparagine synthase C-terminal domain-containing protein [Myxococcota bacterium]|nr:asparagine synthase C-terminal domain-containing protein [Myxococcota bacterium]
MGERLVEGWLDDWSPEGQLGWDFDERLATARGDFALVALACGGLVAASGPGGGHRPVFVVNQPRWVAASTRLRVVLALLETRPGLDIDYLASSVAIETPLVPSATPYRGIHHVPLGQAWLLRAGTEDQRRSTLLDLPQVENTASERENSALLRETIERAVIRATRGATKVGVALSGGLDSSSVLGTMAILRQRGTIASDVEAFSWEFDTPDPADDRPFRRSVERRLGVRSHSVAPAEAAPFVRRGMVLDAMPCTDCPCPLWIALDRAARRRGINRILTGAGGDNVLEGDPTLFGELALRGRPIDAVRKAIFLRMGYTSPWSRVRDFVVRPVVRAMTPETLRARYRMRRERRWLDWMGSRFDRWLVDRNASGSAQAITLNSSPAERYAALACMPFLADVVLLRSQQEEATQYHRIDPLFDDEVLRFVASLPPLALLAGGYARGLLRQAMADCLPVEVRTRLRKAYIDPAFVGMVAASGGFERMEDLARVSRLADLGLVEPKAYRKHFDRMSTHPLDGVWSSAWPALAVEEFLRQYDEGWTS